MRIYQNDLADKKSIYKKILNIIFILVLILYPLRHIFQGIDLWDTGYNYANFEYMGYDHMDSMWLFSTYLANAVGHLITKLPFALSLAGMNFYTGLFVSILAVAGYIFCTKKLQIPEFIAFVGEMTAISLCWCPTALLYNYLTYVLFAACVILLYCGLTAQKLNSVKGRSGNMYLFIAGLCLGANVLVRFSNLPEAALIVAVWAYGVLEWIDDCQIGITDTSILKKTTNRTLICMAGYITSLAVLFIYIHIRYGIGEYIEGVSRLFAMTDTATDYKADSMIMGMVNDYRENLYWVIRIAVFAAVGMVVFALFGLLCGILGRKKPATTEDSRINSVLQLLDSKEYSRIWYVISTIISMILGIIMELWLYQRGFCSVDSYTYGPMRRPAILFMMLAMGIAVIRILTPAAEKKEKLISGLVILVILLTSIGSNNKTYPSINNLFIAAPYTMWELWKFIKNAGDIKIDILSLLNKKAVSPHSASCFATCELNKKNYVGGKHIYLCISSFPAKCILTVFTMIFVVQSFRFGSGFVFAEATGAQNMTAQTENNEVLKGVKMAPERAEWLAGLTEYVNAQGLEGNDVILYGEIPALSFYLQMPAAFNPWSELPSYAVSVFEKDLSATAEKMEKDTAYRPVIILEKEYTDCIDTLILDGEDFRNADVERIAEIIWNTDADSLTVRQKSAAEKFDILLDFIYDMEYSESYRNEKFAVYR